MPVRKLKPVEANDGSYAGMVLAAFDRMESEMSNLPIADTRSETDVSGEGAYAPEGARQVLMPQIENPVNALSYIFGRLNCFSRVDDVTTYPRVTADAIMECVTLAKRFLPQYQVSGTCDGCGEDIAPEFLEAATQVPPDYLPEDFRKRATTVLCEPCRTEGE